MGIKIDKLPVLTLGLFYFALLPIEEWIVANRFVSSSIYIARHPMNSYRSPHARWTMLGDEANDGKETI